MSASETSRLSGGNEPRPVGATTPGLCPHCGHHGPRFTLCADPDCRHGVAFHKIRGNGTRGACDFTTGARGAQCTCKALVITESTHPNGDPS